MRSGGLFCVALRYESVFHLVDVNLEIFEA